ncbi:MAG: ThuA domain-containing protein [Planctomycetes bacterium]|nr:ThuA domain-containing protein [Planctomycetota bacterium]
MPTLVLALLGVLSVSHPAAAAEPGAKPVRVLLVTGVDHPAHDWNKSTPVLVDLLEKDGRFTVRVLRDPALLAPKDVWDVDLVFLHFRNDKPLADESAIRENLAAFVKRGGGLFVLHFASGAFGDWPEYRQIVGRVWDGKNTHDPRGPFTVHVVDNDHPVTRGMSDFGTDDELYIGLEGDRDVRVLATARSVVTGRDHPMAFAFRYGEGRVFHTPLGHDDRAIRAPGAAELIRRGCAWAAGTDP